MRNKRVHKTAPNQSGRPFDIGAMLAQRESDRYALHTQHLNEMMVRVLQTLGFDVGFRTGQGQYLIDRAGSRYLDLLSGWGVFGIGRNHPLLRDTLSQVLASDLPNLVQMDVSVLAGLLAATRRPGIVYCNHAHGLTYGALSANGEEIFKEGFGPLVPGFSAIPFNDLAALEKALSARDVAAFIVEPIQGKGVNLPDDLYLRGAQAICRK